MANMTEIRLTLDMELKEKAEEIFGELGLDFSTAVTVFLKQSIRQGGLPFEMRLMREMDASEPTHAVFSKVMTAQEDAAAGRVINAKESLRRLREKYGV